MSPQSNGLHPSRSPSARWSGSMKLCVRSSTPESGLQSPAIEFRNGYLSLLCALNRRQAPSHPLIEAFSASKARQKHANLARFAPLISLFPALICALSPRSFVLVKGFGRRQSSKGISEWPTFRSSRQRSSIHLLTPAVARSTDRDGASSPGHSSLHSGCLQCCPKSR